MISSICLVLVALILVVFFILFLKRVPQNLKGYYGNPLLILVIICISLITITLTLTIIL